MSYPARDIPDRRLLGLVAAAIAVIVAWFAVRPWLAPAWREPGSPVLYLTGAAGVLLLLVPAAFALAKRAGGSRDPRAWFNAHVVCSLAGAVLIAVHSGGSLRRPPALLLATIVALATLGVWARLRGSRRMAATFASKTGRFTLPDEAARGRLRQLIAAKRVLLTDLDDKANEGTFSVTMSHRKLPRQVDSSKLEFPQRAVARGSVLAAGFPARRAA